MAGRYAPGEKLPRQRELAADLVVADIPMLMCGLSATQGVPGYDWRRHLEMLLDAMRPPTR